MKILHKRPLSPGEKHDLSIFFKSLKNGMLDMNFENYFYESEETAEAVNTLQSLPQDHLPKVLCLWGECSSGKSHLLRAIEKQHENNRLYTTSDQLSQKLQQAIQRDDLNSYRNEFADIELLLVDDGQYLAGKSATLDFIYNDIIPQIHKHVVIASDCDPRSIGILRGDGLVLKIETPPFAVRQRVIRKRAEELQLVLDDEIQDHIASSITDLRRICGFLAYLKATQTSNQ